MYNMYGTTECCVYQACSAVLLHDKSSGAEGKPGAARSVANVRAIRHPISAGVRLHVTVDGDNAHIVPLEDVLNHVNVGADVELVISGVQAGGGYLNMAELTASKFRQHHEHGLCYWTGDIVRVAQDGSVLYRGRRDGMTKIKGLRVETSEVEDIILRGLHPVMLGVAVIPYRGSLVAAVTLAAVEAGIDKERRDEAVRKATRALCMYQLPLVRHPFASLSPPPPSFLAQTNGVFCLRFHIGMPDSCCNTQPAHLRVLTVCVCVRVCVWLIGYTYLFGPTAQRGLPMYNWR